MKKKEKQTNVQGGVKKPFWKKWWFWAIIVVLIIGISTGNSSTNSEDLSTKEGSETVIEDTESTTESETQTEEKETEIVDQETEEILNNTEILVEKIRDTIKGQVGENEYIEDITLENEDLHIYVDFSKVDQTPLTMEDLAISRTVSITDKILEFEDYDDFWQTITVDFKDIGYIRNEKQNIKDSEYGRYFPEENFELEFSTNVEIQEGNEQESKEKNIREAIENVVTKERIEVFNYVPSNNFSLIKFKGSENLTNNMTVKGMYIDIYNILKDIQPMIDTDVDFNVTYPLVDRYGNSEDVIVIKATFTNDTIKKINFKNAIWENIPVMADDWWNHNAVEIAN